MRPRKGTLTLKQAAFRDAILEGFNPSEAYKRAFDASGMSKRSISSKAAELLRDKKIRLAITVAAKAVTRPAILPAPAAHVHLALQRRMDELSHAATLDPIDCFDDLNHFKGIREMPEHVRRCIAGFEVDPVSFILKVKFIDKIRAIMEYSKLAGDIPPQLKTPGGTPSLPARFDLSKLSEEEFKAYLTLKRKAQVEPS